MIFTSCKLSNFLWNVFYIPEQEQPDFGDRAIFSSSSASFVQKITGPNSSLFLCTSILKREKGILFTKYFFKFFADLTTLSTYLVHLEIVLLQESTMQESVNCYWPKCSGSFFTGSRSLALKSSSKSHQMTIFFVQIDEVINKMMSIFSQSSFWMKQVVIW